MLVLLLDICCVGTSGDAECRVAGWMGGREKLALGGLDAWSPGLSLERLFPRPLSCSDTGSLEPGLGWAGALVERN